MGNPDKETVADAPVPAAETIEAQAVTTQPTATATGAITQTAETHTAEATLMPEGTLNNPASAPPTYEECVFHGPH